jgi:hypothetical protein
MNNNPNLNIPIVLNKKPERIFLFSNLDMSDYFFVLIAKMMNPRKVRARRELNSHDFNVQSILIGYLIYALVHATPKNNCSVFMTE